jgi:hypothetical protein
LKIKQRTVSRKIKNGFFKIKNGFLKKLNKGRFLEKSKTVSLSGHQPHCPAAGTEEDRGRPTVAARMPGDTAPPAQGLKAREPRCLEAAPVGIVFRPVIFAVIFDLGVGPVGGWSSGRGEVAGRDGGSSSVFLAGASGSGGFLRGSCHSGGLGGWLPGWWAGDWASC